MYIYFVPDTKSINVHFENHFVKKYESVMWTLMRKISCVVWWLCLTVICFGQSEPDWRLWTTSGVKVRTHKKLSFGLSYFTAYNFSQRQIKYDQWRLSATYSPKRRWYLTTAYVRGQSKTSKNITHRIVGEIAYPTTIPFDFITQYFTAEKFFPATSKYGWRISYALRLKETLLEQPFRIAPYASGRLFYFYGGRLIQRYDDTGERTYKSAGNGLHRFRGTLGVDMRPTKHLQLKMFWMIQREFNVGSRRTEINVINPNNGKISRRFSNYPVLGVSGAIRLDARK